MLARTGATALTSSLSAEAARAARSLPTRGPRRSVLGLPRAALRSFRGRSARVNERPVFVLGNQKSGTSAIAALLGVMTGERVALDFPAERTKDPAFIRRLLGDISFDEFIERNLLDFSSAIVKEPNLTLLYDDLAHRFPAARFVFVVRDPRDNIRSILDWVEVPGDLEALDSAHTEELTTVQRSVLDAAWLGLAAPETHYVEQLATRWRFLADVYLENQGTIVLQRYEDFRADKEGSIRRLADRVGLRPGRRIGEVADKQFQPPGRRRGKSWYEFFGVANLSRIVAVCAPQMSALGYLDDAPTLDPRPSRTSDE
jgi:hypothetical protein